jgi:hypothetical protein
MGLYFGEADPSTTYGAAGTIVLILLWVSGDVLATNNAGTNQLYSGTGASGKSPAGTSAFVVGATSMGHSVAYNSTGVDGGTWIVVQ